MGSTGHLPFSVQHCHMYVCARVHGLRLPTCPSRKWVWSCPIPILPHVCPARLPGFSESRNNCEIWRTWITGDNTRKKPREVQESAGEKAPSNVSRRPATTSVCNGGT